MAPRKFMDEVRFAMRSAQLSYRTEQSYCAVIRRFILFHGRRHPAELGASEVALYLTALAEEQHTAPRLNTLRSARSPFCIVSS